MVRRPEWMLALVFLTLTAALSAALRPAGAAPGTSPTADRALRTGVSSPRDHGEEADQHGKPGGHLPASSSNVELVGKLRLTSAEGGIADVAARGHYAYLNTFVAECRPAPGSHGTGVHIVDIVDPAHPVEVGFIPADPNSTPGEGIHILPVATPTFTGDLLLHNNEPCDDDRFSPGGISIWDVTDPRNPKFLANAGDSSPVSPNQAFHSTHSVQGWAPPGKAYAALQDDDERKDLDILDLTDPRHPRMVAEYGIEDWPTAQSPLAYGQTVFHHDMQLKELDGRWFMLLSYWDAGQILLDVTHPAEARFVRRSDAPSPDLAGFDVPEGNSHESYWSTDGRYVLSTDENFRPVRTRLRVTGGPGAGWYDAESSEGSLAPDPGPDLPDGFSGATVFGGSGCRGDADGDGRPDRDVVPAADTAGAAVVVFARGTCTVGEKVQTGQAAGYRRILIANSHDRARFPDTVGCPSVDDAPSAVTSSVVCVGHRVAHLLFGDPPQYGPPESSGFAPGGDIPLGAKGAPVSASTRFHGWGYVHLHDGGSLREIGAYAIPEAFNPSLVKGHGALTVHEVKTDPRPGVNLAYASWYAGGLRVLSYGPRGIQEVGHYIAEGGNNFWGTFPLLPENHQTMVTADQRERPLLLLSDMDSGLWIFRYTGPERPD